MRKIFLKILSTTLLLTIFLSAFSFFVYAKDSIASDNQNNTEVSKKELLDEKLLSFSCHYDAQSKTAHLKGTMDYDAFALYGDATLLIYSIPAGRTEEDVINDPSSAPIAESPVSITFAFSFKISTVKQRYCRYAIFLRSSEGKYILTTEAQYAETDAKFEIIDNKDFFKGLSGDYSSKISDVNSQITIIPIYLDLLFTDDLSGYIYQVDGVQISFNNNYIDEIDSQIRSLSLFNTTVYLQFLLRSGGILPTYMSEGAEYALPNTFDQETILYLHAATNFLVSRYEDHSNGSISGIILGKAWDNYSRYNSFKDISFDKYVSMCGNYGAIVSNAARDINPNINIMLSLDGNGFFIDNKENTFTNERFSAKELLSSLMKYFDASSYSGLKCLLLIETYETPLDITSNDLVSGIDIDKTLNDNKFYIGKQNYISEFLNELSIEYKSAVNHYNILWIPKKEISGNTLCAAYSYAFYELLTDSNILSFNVEFSEKEGNIQNLNDLIFILKNIDMKDSFKVTENLLAYYNKSNWSEVIRKELIEPSKDNRYYADVLAHLPKNIKGEFSYFDFSEVFLPEGWLNGVSSSDIKIDYLLSGDKALKSTFSFENNDFCDLIYIYEYPENITYTPYIKFNLEIISEQSSPLFEIKILFKSENVTIESNAILEGNNQQEIILDISKITDFALLDSMKISVRSLDDSVENCTLCIQDITGYSKKYSDNELASLIEKERDKQKHDNSDNTYNLWIRIGIVALIVIISAFFGFILIFILQKNSRNRRKE